IPVRPSLPRTPRTSSFFFAASAASSGSTAPVTASDPTAVPDDRFGFKRASQPEEIFTASSSANTEKWKMSTWVPVFVVVALAAGWVAGRGMWRAGRQGPAVGGSDALASADTATETISAAPSDPAEIEVLDLSGHRWLIPMETGPVRSPSSKV